MGIEKIAIISAINKSMKKSKWFNKFREKSKKLGGKLDWPNLILGAIIGVLITWFFQPIFENFNRRLNLSNVESLNCNSNDIELIGKYGKLINLYKTNYIIRICFLEDVIGDSKKEIIIGIDEGGDKSGFIQIYSIEMDLIWEFDTYDTSVMNKLDKVKGAHSDYFKIAHMSIVDLFNNGKKYLVATAQDPTWFTNRIVIIDLSNFELVGSYWHPGILNQMEIADIDGNDTLELIFCGLNNQLRNYFETNHNIPVVFVMSPNNMHGQAFPGAYLDLEIVPTIWYSVIPPIDKEAKIKIEDHDFNKLKDIRVYNFGQFYYFNDKGELIAVANSDSKLQRSNQTGTPFPIMIKKENQRWGFQLATLNIKNLTKDVGGLHLNKACKYYYNGDFDNATRELTLAEIINPQLKRIVNLWLIRAEKNGIYGTLGVSFDETYQTIKVKSVVENSPAFSAGIMVGDLILSFDETILVDYIDLQTRVAEKKPGDSVNLLIERKKSILTYKIALGNSLDYR